MTAPDTAPNGDQDRVTDSAATPGGKWDDDPASLRAWADDFERRAAVLAEKARELRESADAYTTRADTMRRRAGLIDLQNEAKEAAERGR